MNFWAWANRRSESAVEFVLKLILAILIVFAFGGVLVAASNRGALDRVTRPSLTMDTCGDQRVAEVVQAQFVTAYNAQAWSNHLLLSDISLTKPSAVQLRSDVQRVECTAVMVVGMQHTRDRRIAVSVTYSIARQSGSSEFLVETSHRSADFVGRGFGNVARPGTQRD